MYKTTVISLAFVCLCSMYCFSQNSVVIVKSNLFQYEFARCNYDYDSDFKTIAVLPYEIYEQQTIENRNFLFITNRSEYYQITKNPKDINFNEYNLIIGTLGINYNNTNYKNTEIHVLFNGTEHMIQISAVNFYVLPGRSGLKRQQISFLVPKKYCDSPHQICYSLMHM